MTAAVMVLAALFAGCKTAQQCSEEQPCGFGEVCFEGECISKSCSSSQQCEVESYCAKGSCTAGCEVDGDCYPGDVCDADAHTCVAGACRSSTLDCDFKEFCDVSTGECYAASGWYCHECASDDDCGGDGNYCWNWGQSRQFCGVQCSAEDDCPSGFTCIPLENAEGAIVYQCVTYCWLYEDGDDDLRELPPASPMAVCPAEGAAP